MAFGTFKIIAGDFKIGNEHQFLSGQLTLKKDGKFLRVKYKLSDLKSLERVSQEEGRSGGKAVGWGVAGAVVAGPLGAVAAGYLGSKKNEVTFVCQLNDGKQFVGVMNTSDYAKLEAPMLLKPNSDS